MLAFLAALGWLFTAVVGGVVVVAFAALVLACTVRLLSRLIL